MPRNLASIVASLNRAGELVGAPESDPVVNGLTTDSRTVEPGLVYFAVRGSRLDGHRFLADAVARGAAAVAVEEPAQLAVPQVVVRNGRRAVQVAAQEWYGDPARHLTLVGVTGTNGKTTTTALVRHLLNAGETAGSMGTLGAFDGTGAAIPSEAGSLTTPGPIGLQATLATLVDRGCEHVAMEASS
ncbi:MAG: Mur ligase family protein, partial [Gemmatimonadales bacterium]